jgi:hypothetical protein
VWRPVLIACLVAACLGMLEYIPAFSPYGMFRVMNGETYYRQSELPWIGLVLNAAITVTLLRTAAVKLAQKDF